MYIEGYRIRNAHTCRFGSNYSTNNLGWTTFWTLPCMIRPTRLDLHTHARPALQLLNMLSTNKRHLHTCNCSPFFGQIDVFYKFPTPQAIGWMLEEQVTYKLNHCQWLKEPVVCICWNRSYKESLSNALFCSSNLNPWGQLYQLLIPWRNNLGPRMQSHSGVNIYPILKEGSH